jgi:protein-L-isoaspartate O-methyltransferase
MSPRSHRSRRRPQTSWTRCDYNAVVIGGTETAAAPIALDRVETIERVRDTLGELGYTGAAIRDLLGDDAFQTRQRDVPVHLRRLTEGTPLETAIRLFFLGVQVPETTLERDLAPLRVEELQELGLVQPTGSGVRSTVRLVPHAELLLAGNRYPDEEPEGAPADYVATVTAPSAILAALTVRRRARAALDIGTGSGVQALWAARHSDRVVAVDVNPRALNLAAFNARLNGVENVELRAGSLYEPVRGERFDLIVCNAPYVVSPDTRYAYRDSGVAADAFCERLVRESAAHLQEGGFAHLLVGWILGDADWWERPRSWIEGGECDCWLLLGVARDPLTHAAVWNDELARDPDRFGETLDRWVGYLHDLGADAVAEGAVVLRRRSGAANWFRADRVPPGRPSPDGDQVLRVFAAQDFLHGAGEEALLDQRLSLAPSVRVEQELTCRDGGYVVETMTLALGEGLGFRAGIDQNTASLVPLLDGELPLRAAIAAAAGSRGLDDADREAFHRGAIEIVRTMLELGFLVFESDAAAR